jgi:hypothetical protein
MKRTDFALVMITTVALLAASQARAAVKVETAEPVQRSVAFRTIGNRFITASPSNALDLSGVKLGGRQTFELIDITGGELADGHEVRIRHTPNTGKPSYWLEARDGIRRGHDGDVFKIRRVDTKAALVTRTGKFVATPTVANALGVSDKPEGALLVEILDTSTRVPIWKSADQPAPAPSETLSPISSPPSAPGKSEATP